MTENSQESGFKDSQRSVTLNPRLSTSDSCYRHTFRLSPTTAFVYAHARKPALDARGLRSQVSCPAANTL
jgi:hypothetical protein